MSNDVYDRLASHMDRLPAGYPRTESGVELRILQRLFTPEEAELALHLTLIAETPGVIARRAGIPETVAEHLLAAMESRGTVYVRHRRGRPPRYMATQFAIGVFEFQVNRLDLEMAADLEEYMPLWFDQSAWQQVPQLRTIPVAESIAVDTEILPYECATTIVRTQRRFAVAPCICRREQHILGQGCDAPRENCLVFNDAADFYIHNGLGKECNLDQVLATLAQAEEAGLVLQPNNARHLQNICICCGCCCAALRNIKRHPKPVLLVSSPFRARVDHARCTGCGVCVRRCQMEAVGLVDGSAIVDIDRCIGCGLCVSTCAPKAVVLERKPASEQRPVPRSGAGTIIQLAQARGLLRPPEMIRMLIRSGIDRLRCRD